MNYIFSTYYFPNFNPEIFSLGFISFRWYGLMYIISFLFTKSIVNYKIKRNSNYHFLDEKKVEKVFYLGFFGVLFGGRIGYALIYDLYFFLENPTHLLKIWTGGMSFHGGLIGVIVVLFFYSKKMGCHLFQITDLITPIVPFGLGMGRLGNFINGELWGKVTKNSYLSMFFPTSKFEDLKFIETHPEWRSTFNTYGMLPRHPSQLYELFFEGIFLFFLLNFFSKKKCPQGGISGLFIFFYGIIRFLVEFFRQPDPQIGLLVNVFSMGQILSVPMIIFGAIIVTRSYKH